HDEEEEFVAIVRTVSPDGRIVDLAVKAPTEVSPRESYSPEWLLYCDPRDSKSIFIGAAEPSKQVTVNFFDKWVTVMRATEDILTCQVVHHAQRRVLAMIKLLGANCGFARQFGTDVWVGDDRGRLIALDLETGELTLNRRIS